MSNFENQHSFWADDKGDKWAERLRSFDSAYNNWEQDAKIKLIDLMQEFFWDIPKDSRILECGCGPGWVLKTLQDLNFTNLIGCDINTLAIEIARETHKRMTFANTSIETYLKLNGTFDLIMTSVFLIHMHPKQLEDVMAKIYDRAEKYIFGRELSTATPEDNPGGSERFRGQYRTRRFKDKWLEMYPDLKVLKYKLIPMQSKIDWVTTEVYLLAK